MNSLNIKMVIKNRNIDLRLGLFVKIIFRQEKRKNKGEKKRKKRWLQNKYFNLKIVVCRVKRIIYCSLKYFIV